MAIKGGPGPAANTHVTLQRCWVHCAGVAGRCYSHSPGTALRLSEHPTTMPRPYTPALLNMWLALLLVVPLLVSGHMIEVPASKKECFFEDLHINDKVRPTTPA